MRLIGRSDAIRSIEADIDCAARSDAKVLITGETGVGKDVVARLIHARSARCAEAFVAVNCAGVPDSLLESELFGHGRGSFTGAYRDKPGLLEMAPNGTLFLDEVGEMSARMQVVLLRFLETGEIQQLGAARAHRMVNVRLITATNRDLRTLIAQGLFREDLYFRLNVIRISVPPLRERVEDIPILVEHYLHAYARHHRVQTPQIIASTLNVLAAHQWPGNVRELKNVVERLVLRSVGQPLRPADLPPDLFQTALHRTATATARGQVPPPRKAAADDLAARMLERDESFWAVVYPLFMARDITRADLRRIVQIGLENTNGDYRTLTRVFGMADSDYPRFLSFLRKHECHLPFQKFRGTRAPTTNADLA